MLALRVVSHGTVFAPDPWRLVLATAGVHEGWQAHAVTQAWQLLTERISVLTCDLVPSRGTLQ